MRVRVITLAHGQPEYADLLGQIRSDAELVAALWDHAESRPDELDVPGTWWSVVMVEDKGVWVLAAWCAARVEGDFLKAFHNYEVEQWRNRDLYRLAYEERHNVVIVPFRRPARTFLFGQPPGSLLPDGTPIEQHEADGWQKSGPNGPGELDGHWWWELVLAS